jgi:hypothetical protein
VPESGLMDGLFPPGIDLGARAPGADGCRSPIGRQRARRPRVRRARPSTAAVVLEPRQLLEQQHAELMEAIGALRQARRNEHESLPAVLRRICEIERVLKLTELHVPPRTSRHRPLA